MIKINSLKFFFFMMLLQTTFVWSTNSIFEDLSDVQKNSSYMQVHHLPRSLKELHEAKKFHLIASRMLDQGKGIEALPYLELAESFYVPETLSLRWGISYGRYPNLPDEIKQNIRATMPDKEQFERLLKSREKIFSLNEIKLIKDNRRSFFSYFMKDVKQVFWQKSTVHSQNNIPLSCVQDLNNKKVD